MEPREIVEKLKVSPYKFTLAHKIRDEIKKLDDDQCEYIRMELRRELADAGNAEIHQPLREILR